MQPPCFNSLLDDIGEGRTGKPEATQVARLPPNHYH